MLAWLLFHLIGFSEWHQGVIVTRDNEVLQCEFKMEWRYDALIVREGKGSRLYPAHRIRSFRYYDREKNINRKFTIAESVKKGLRRQRFFEIVADGELQVLRNLKTYRGAYHDKTDYEPNRLISLSEEANAYHYFVRAEGKWYTLRQFRRKVLPSLDPSLLMAGVRKTGADLNSPAALIRLIIQYNRDQAPAEFEAAARK